MKTIFSFIFLACLSAPAQVGFLNVSQAFVGSGSQVASTPAGWSPTSPTNTLLVWLCASNAFTDTGMTTLATDGQEVAALKAMTGTNHFLASGEEGYCPHMDTGVQNSQPGILYDVGYPMLCGSISKAQSYTWVAVVKTPASFVGNTIIGGTNGGASFYIGATTVNIYAGTDLTTAISVGTPYMIEAIGNSSSSSIGLNANSATTGDAGTASWEGGSLGASTANQYPFNGHFFELFMWTGELTASDRASLRTWVNSKYAIW